MVLMNVYLITMAGFQALTTIYSAKVTIKALLQQV